MLLVDIVGLIVCMSRQQRPLDVLIPNFLSACCGYALSLQVRASSSITQREASLSPEELTVPAGGKRAPLYSMSGIEAISSREK